jgi:hypothetical protein
MIFITFYLLGGRNSDRVFPEPTNLRALSVEGYYSIFLHKDGWRSKEGLQLAPRTLEQILSAFSALRYQLPPSPIDRPALRTTSITASYGSTVITVALGPPQPNTGVRYAWREDEGRVFLISEKLVQRLLHNEVLMQQPISFDPLKLTAVHLRRPGLALMDLHFKKTPSEWEVSDQNTTVLGDSEDVDTFFRQFAKMFAKELSAETVRRMSPARELPTNPFLVGELHFLDGQSHTLSFYEVASLRGPPRESKLLVQRDEEKNYFWLRSPLPMELHRDAEGFRSRTLFAANTQADVAALCAFREHTPLFRLRPENEQWFLSPGCTPGTPEKLVLSSLVAELLQLRVITFTPQPVRSSPHASQEPPVHLVVYRSADLSEKQERFSVTLRPPTQIAIMPWEITINTDKERYAVLSSTSASVLLREIRILENLSINSQ